MDQDPHGVVSNGVTSTTGKTTGATPTLAKHTFESMSPSRAEVTPTPCEKSIATTSDNATPIPCDNPMSTSNEEVMPISSDKAISIPRSTGKSMPTLNACTETMPAFDQHNSSIKTTPTSIQTEAHPMPLYGNYTKDGSNEERSSQPTHFLVCSNMVDGLMQPMRASIRVKYVCMAIAKRLIAMGTNTGVVYLFSRVSLRRIHVIPAETEGSIVQIALNNHGSLLAYGTSKGHVLVSRLYPESGAKPGRVQCAFEHVGTRVLVLKWNETSQRLYIGDDLGQVTVVNFLSLSQKTLNSLGPPSEIILNLESPVIQIDARNDKLLVATRTKTILCDHIKHQYSQIGKRLRDGRFGSCFSGQQVAGQGSLIYCSRPGSRIWTVDHDGTVLNTHQFKLLLDTPPTPIFNLNDWSAADFDPLPAPGPQSVTFQKLLPCGERYLLTFTSKGLYILDAEAAKLVIWNHQNTDIEDVCCHGNEIYVLKTSGELQRLELLTIHSLWTRLFSRQMYEAAGWLFVTHQVLACKCPGVGAPVIRDLATKITDVKVKEVLLSCVCDIEATDEVRGGRVTPDVYYEKLDSGIFKIRRQSIDKILQQSRTGRQIDEHLVVGNGSVNLSAGEIKPNKLADDIPIAEVRTGATAGTLINGSLSSEPLEEGFSKSQDLNLSPEQDLMKSSTASSSDDLWSIGPGVGLPMYVSEDTVAPSSATKSINELQAETTQVSGNIQELASDTQTVTSHTMIKMSKSPTDPVAELEVAVPNVVGLDVSVEDQAQPNRFISIKERISSRVKSTTWSVIQNIKEKTQLTRTMPPPDDKEEEVSLTDAVPVEYACSVMEGIMTTPLQDCKPGRMYKESQFPSVDTEKLIEVTEVCRKSIDDPKTRNDPSLAWTALTTWAEELNRTLKALHSAIIVNKRRHMTCNNLTDQDKDLPEAHRIQNHKHSGIEQSVDLFYVNNKHTDICGDLIEADQAESERIYQIPEADDTVVVDDMTSLCGSTKLQPGEKYIDTDAVEKACLIDILSVDGDTCRISDRANTDNIRHFRDAIYTLDPFHLPPGAYEDASQLAQLCMSFGCYGDISDIVYTPMKKKDCDLKHASNENNNSPVEIIDGVLRSVPNTEGDCIHKEQKDELTMFLCCHFHFLSRHLDQLHLVITRGHGQQRFERWKTFVTCLLDLTADDTVTRHIMDQEVNMAIDMLRSQASQRGIMILAFIVRLYGMAPWHTLAFCAEICTHIPPLDVYLFTSMGSKLNEHFLFYACSMLNMGVNHLDWERAMSTFLNDVELRDVLLTCLLQHKPHTNLSCTCDLPWPGAHLQPWPHEELLQRILGQRSSWVSEVKDLCWSHGYWKGVIRLCHREVSGDADHDSLQEIVLQLGDVNLLIRDSDTGYFPKSIAEWEKLLAKRSAQGYGHLAISGSEDPVLCLGCSRPLLMRTGSDDSSHSQYTSSPRMKYTPESNKTNELPEADQETLQNLTDGADSREDVSSCWTPDVTWERLATMLVQETGLRLSMEMLQRVKIPQGALPMSFFTRCVMAATLHRYQTDLTSNMQHVDTHLSLVRPGSMAPQIEMAVLHEKRDVKPNLETEKMFQRLHSSRTFLQTMEGDATRWGISVDLSAPCHGCTLSLQTTVSPLQTGAIFYRCAHGFHRACSSATSCKICSSQLPDP